VSGRENNNYKIIPNSSLREEHQRPALISISLAVSESPAYTARPQIRG